MTGPEHAVAVQRAAPHGAVLGPALRGTNQAFDEALGNPPGMGQKRQVDVDERIRRGEPLPGRDEAAEAVDDPAIPLEEYE